MQRFVPPMSTPSNLSVAEHTAQLRSCVHCGVSSDREPLTLGLGGQPVACTDMRACSERAASRDAHLDSRWSITAAGLAALAAMSTPDPDDDPPPAIRPILGRPGAFVAASRTLPNTRYILTVIGGVVRCTCPGMRYVGKCWHAAAVKSLAEVAA